MAEFAAKNNNSASIKFFSFFASTGLYLYMSFNVFDLLNTIIFKRINKKKTIDIFKTIQLT